MTFENVYLRAPVEPEQATDIGQLTDTCNKFGAFFCPYAAVCMYSCMYACKSKLMSCMYVCVCLCTTPTLTGFFGGVYITYHISSACMYETYNAVMYVCLYA